MPSIDIINLGCAKNLVDAESLLTQLRANGVQSALNPEKLTGNVTIINTCGFISDAKEESIQTIFEAAAYKNTDAENQLLVMGCLSERYKESLKAEIPEVDAFYGVNDIPTIIKDLGLSYQQDKVQARLHSTAAHYAYLKIAEGCDRNCSFCAIPNIRGKQISQSIEDLVIQARYLVSQGVKELILISQELTRYGIDIYKKPALTRLLQSLEEIEGLQWIRLHYTYPNLFEADLIQQMARSSKICHYLDIPFQHFNDAVLLQMRRGHTKQEGIDLIQSIRQAIPDIAIRTTILVGHPGETEEAFQELLDALAELKFDRLGVFTYSHEEGTHAYKHYKDEISPTVKRNRADAVMELQQEISLQKNIEKIGQTHRLVVDRLEGEHMICRTQYDSPEVDNEVIVDSAGLTHSLGSFFEAVITDANEFDLIAKPC